MYIRAKEVKKKYQLYLCHSKRVNGKSAKLLNKYLCSIDKEYIHGAADDAYGGIMDDIRDSIKQNLSKIPKDIHSELAEEFKKFPSLLIDKIVELSSNKSDDEEV